MLYVDGKNGRLTCVITGGRKATHRDTHLLRPHNHFFTAGLCVVDKLLEN